MATEKPVRNEIDARTFQQPLAELIETLAYKMEREATKSMNPSFVAVDIHVMLRQILKVYELFFYVNADVRRTDPAWHVGYAAAIFPLVRCMIDCLYNVTTLLLDPMKNGRYFRASGYRQVLASIAEDQKRYGGNPEWDAHSQERRKAIDVDMAINGFPLDEVQNGPWWLTLGAYLRDQTPAPNKPFLEQLTLGFWREYSAMAHVTFYGLMPTAVLFEPRKVALEDQKQFENYTDRMLSMHLLRVVGILLCILTEIQAHFRFADANINKRLSDGWTAVLAAPEIKELYEYRYAQLVKESGIIP